MARRTVDQPTTPTETPALHGHYDGPRGHQDEHRHLGGDKEHGHPDRQALGRVVGRQEYVHGDMLALARHDLAERQRVAALDDAPTGEMPALVGAFTPAADLVKTTTTSNGDSGRDLTFPELTRIVEVAETLRFEGQTEIGLLSVLTEAFSQSARREEVHPDLIDKGRLLFESWMIQRGLRKVEGGRS